ncbi:MAG: hypothetical protein ACO2ON_03830 [Candidatus Nanopusillus sp.]
MGYIIAKLFGNELVVFRAGEIDDLNTDIIFYIYKKDEPFLELLENESKEEETPISIEEINKVGIKLILVKKLEKAVIKKHELLTQNIAEKTSGGEDLAYKLFGFLLFVKLSIKTMISSMYSNHLTELSQLIVGFEDEIAYNLTHYFLNKLDYKISFSNNILDKLKNKDKFTYYYKKLKESLNISLAQKKDLNKEAVEMAYTLFSQSINKSK